jgi:hypothetical protein
MTEEMNDRESDLHVISALTPSPNEMKVMTMRMNNSMSNRMKKHHKWNNKIPERGDIFSDSLFTYKCTWYLCKERNQERKQTSIDCRTATEDEENDERNNGKRVNEWTFQHN